MAQQRSEVRFEETEMKQRLEEIRSSGEMEVAGETHIEDDVIASIASVAASQVEGISSLGKSSITRSISERFGAEGRSKGVEVEAGKKEAIIDLTLRVIYGFSIPQIVIEVRKKVAQALWEYTGLIAREINVEIAGIEFPERMSRVE